MLNKEQKKLYNLPDRKMEDWEEEYESIYFFYITKLHDSGYRFIVIVNDKQNKNIGRGDVLWLRVPDNIQIDCNRNGIFHLWNWNYNLKVRGCSTIDIILGSKKEQNNEK